MALAPGPSPFHDPALGPLPLAQPLFMVRPMAPCTMARPLLHGPAPGPGPLVRPLAPCPWPGPFYMVRPLAPGPDPDFDFLGGFPKVAKRFWPLRPPIGLRFGSFAITRRGLTDPLDGFGLKRPMARNSNPAFFLLFGPPPWPPIIPLLAL